MMQTEVSRNQIADSRNSSYRWFILTLATATYTFGMAIPFSCLPALFKEISNEMNLTLVQVGAIWGAATLAAVFTSLLGGWLGDRFGAKRMLAIGCIVTGVAGASRGLAGNFVMLAATMFIFGLIRSLIQPSVFKVVALWFVGKNLAMGNGVVSMGMGVGLMLGPLISATWLSPLLGGWRHVLFLYGAISILVGILWAVFGREPARDAVSDGSARAEPIRTTLGKLVRNKTIWLLALTLMFRMASVIGMTGYLPLYLEGRGWLKTEADVSLAVFYAASAIAVIPLSIAADRLGSRKGVLFAAVLTGVFGISLLAFVNGFMTWIAIIAVGMFMDGFMAVSLTMVQETPGVGAKYSGTALGLVMTVSGLGAFLSPPLGNSLATISTGMPFLFWASLSLIPLLLLFFIHETGRRNSRK